MITREQLEKWKADPVTQRLGELVNGDFEAASAVESISLDGSMEMIGGRTIAKVNYIKGLRDALDVESLFAEDMQETES